MSRPKLKSSLFFPALAALPISIGLGVAIGLWTARGSVEAQRYPQLGFSRSEFIGYRDGALEGARAGLSWSWLAVLVAALVGALVAWRGGDFSARGWRNLAASRSARAWLVALCGAGATAMLFIVERDGGQIGKAELAYVLVITVAVALVLQCLGRYAEQDAAGDGPRRVATVAASLQALALLVIAGGWVNRNALSYPTNPRTWGLDALLLVLAAVLFWWTRRRALAQLGGRPTRQRTGPLAISSALGLLLSVFAWSLGSFESALGPPALRAQQPLNVLLIGIDTLRADATSIYGPSLHGHDTTPNLRALAARGVAFTNAVSQAPWTLPAFASIQTGAYPHEHGAYSLSGALRDREVLIPEVLREAGYQTSAVVSHIYLNKNHGFDQGYDSFDSSNSLGHRAITSKAVTDASIAALTKDRGGPFFHFVHYFDAHYEYMDQPDQHWADGYQGWLRHELDFDNLLKNRQLLGKSEQEWLVDLYEEEIAFLDSQVGRLLAWLDANGLRDNTLILVVGDHGEEFLDHGTFGHTTTLYQELLHVPLLVVPPKMQHGCTFDGVVETRSIYGTLLDLLDVDFARTAREHSLMRRVGPECEALGNGPGKAFSIVWLPDAKLEWGKHVRSSALRDGRWKLIRDYTCEKSLLFDLESDPAEQHDLAAAEPERAQQMLDVLETWTQEQQNRGGATKVPIDPKELGALKQLGYL